MINTTIKFMGILCRPRLIPILTLVFLTFIASAQGQTTVFTYQGLFTDATLPQPTNGTYTMTFRLYDAATGGSQVPDSSSAVTSLVTVVNNVFTARLDFGATAFGTGQPRYLQIQVGSTVLAPRQEITAAPFAIRAAGAGNADRLGNVAASQYVQTTDTRLSDSRAPSAGSTNYIQNTTTQQASTNFNISGSGTLGGTLTAGGLAANRVLARGGEPGLNGVSNNGYAFSGNNGDNDSGLFSTASGRVSLYADNVERVRADNTGITVTGNLTATGTISGVVKTVNGLTGAVTLAAGPGITLTTSGSTVTVSTPTSFKKFVVGGLIGGGYQYMVDHNLNSTDVIVQIYDVNGFLVTAGRTPATGDTFVKVVDANNVLIGIYSSGTYRVVIIA